MIADEIQSGLGRTGTTFACEHEDVVPDMYVLGKALGGGIVPVSAVVSSADVLGVFKPGQHGSTFGGNPLACAIAREVIAMLVTGEFQERSAKLGTHLHDRLSALPAHVVREVRGRGLWAGVDFAELDGREVSERLMPSRRAGQGHPRQHGQARTAAGDQPGGSGLGPRPRRGDRPLTVTRATWRPSRRAVSGRGELAAGGHQGRPLPRRPSAALVRPPRAGHRPRGDPLGPGSHDPRNPPGRPGRGRLRLAAGLGVPAVLTPAPPGVNPLRMLLPAVA